MPTHRVRLGRCAGPPENVRDHVLAASKALSSGDWALSYQFLATMTVWALVPRREEVRTSLPAISIHSHRLSFPSLAGAST